MVNSMCGLVSTAALHALLDIACRNIQFILSFFANAQSHIHESMQTCMSHRTRMPCARGCGVGWCVRCVGGGCSCVGAWVREAAGVCVCVGGWVVSVDGECVESKAGDQVREPLAGNTCVCGVVFTVCLCEGWQSVRLCDGKVGGGVGERPRRRPCSACSCAPEFQNLQNMFVNLRADPLPGHTPCWARTHDLWLIRPSL